MEIFQTALGRFVPAHEAQTILEDAILDFLFIFRMNLQNPNNVPLPVSVISRAVSSDPGLALAALDALKESVPPLVEEGTVHQGERTFRVSGTGVRFVRNMPQGMDSLP